MRILKTSFQRSENGTALLNKMLAAALSVALILLITNHRLRGDKAGKRYWLYRMRRMITLK